ncbi:MAG TPA: sigma-70 family RNA polymerase sigma factor [Steroidobacteraceae bacterium]|nr:sigma-70 family RNA polymerase sigma factor [Steroidobacteraceae bacterium]
MPQADKTLVDQLLRGEQRAFDAFFNEYYPRLFRFALRRGLARDVAEDVAQATVCRALESLHTYRGEAALMSWLCTLCRREMSSRWSQEEMRPSLQEDDPEIRAALEAMMNAEADEPLAATQASQLREAVLAALDYLPPLYADVLESKYVKEMSVEAIAHRIGKSAKATESLLTRARESFRETFALLQDSSSLPASK